MKTIKKSIYMLLVLIILINTLSPIVTAYTVKLGDKTRLFAERELPGFVEFKSKKQLKMVMRVSYIDPDTKERLDAFCLEPLKDGVGTGGGDSYLTEITKEIDDMRVWRALYHGYLGKKWNETTILDTDNKEMKSGPVVESDDDWYFVSKLVIHCLNENPPVSPKTKYKIPTFVANSDIKAGLTLADVQRRGQKILDAAEHLYNYAVTGTDNYASVTLSLSKSGSIYTEGDNLAQNFILSHNRELKNYEVLLEGFPETATYTKSGDTISVKIPKKNILQDIKGTIKINKVELKTCPAFYAEAYNPDYQDYVVVATPYEQLSTSTTFELKANNSKIEIMKVDKDTKEPVSNTTLEISKDGNVVTTVKTDESGKATIENLYPGTYDVKEIEANENYILSDEVKKVELGYNGVAKVTFENTRKTGNLKLIKVDKDNNQIALGNVEFDLYSEEKGKVIGTYYTNADGEILVENLRVGNYSWIEKSTNKWYKLNDTKTLVTVKENETVETKIENELKKGQIKVIKVDKDNNEIKLQGVEFEVYDEAGNFIETLVTDQNGEAITKKLPIDQKYTIKETKTLEKYVLSDEEKTVVLEENKITTLKFTNEKIKGYIEIKKVSADDNSITNEKKGTALKGAVFEIYNEKDELVDTITTKEDGKATSKLLEYGKYYITEKDTGSKYYVLNTNKYEIEINQNLKTVGITIENKSVEVKKKLPRTGF